MAAKRLLRRSRAPSPRRTSTFFVPVARAQRQISPSPSAPPVEACPPGQTLLPRRLPVFQVALPASTVGPLAHLPRLPQAHNTPLLSILPVLPHPAPMLLLAVAHPLWDSMPMPVGLG